MHPPKRLLLTGGGTAGHVNPALAIGAALRGPATELLFVGVRGRAEEQVVPKEGIPIRFVRASGFPGARPSPALLRFAVNLAVGILQAAFLLLRFRPDVIVGTGGFASAPVLLAAAGLRRIGLLRTKVYVHEQNAVPGKLNRLVGGLADEVFVTFPESLSHFPGNAVVTGYPLRRRIGSVGRDEARKALDFAIPEGRTVVFLFGGSQGARTLNRALVDGLADLLPHRDRLFVIHGTGLARKGGYDPAADVEARLAARYSEEERRLIGGFYVARPYFHDIEKVYAVADLAVTRAGAGSLNEIATVGLPALVVPKANLPGDHQVLNARALERAGGAEVLYEETVLDEGHLAERLDGRLLAEKVLALAGDPAHLAAMAAAARAFLGRDALDAIRRRVAGESDPAEEPPAAAVPPETVPTSAALLSRLEKAHAARKGPWCPSAVVRDRRDLAYFVSRASSLLVAEAWEDRNRGVKLLGLLGAREKVPLLVALLKDRTPAPLIQRFLGGDFVQVGFIRRNVMAALARLGQATPDVEEALLLSVDDPYYEVRAEGARAAAALADGLTRRDEVARGLVRLLGDRNLEVAAAAAEALGKVGGEADAVPALLSLAGYEFWKVRASALKGLLTLVERGAVSDLPALRARLPEFVLVSPDFVPQFEIKAAYRRLAQAVGGRQEGQG